MPVVKTAGPTKWAQKSWTCENCRSAVWFDVEDLVTTKLYWQKMGSSTNPEWIVIKLWSDCPQCKRACYFV